MADQFADARAYLRHADPVLASLIDANPDLEPRAWMRELPKMDAFGALLFQIIGQQLSVRSTRAILARLEGLFGGHLPEPQEVLDAGPERLQRADAAHPRRPVRRRRVQRRDVPAKLR
jgi:DNA-3-methyladenine glycosylase II